jgi:transposase
LVSKKKTIAASERDETARAEWREKQSTLDPDKLVVLDECGTHTSLTRTYAWAERGKRAYGRVPRNYGRNVTVLSGLTSAGLLPELAVTIEGAVNTVVFEGYIEQVLAPRLVAGQTVILDNLAAHKSAKVRELIAARDCTLLFLPAYSPDLSPIELAFSKLKGHLRKVGARSRDELRAAIESGMVSVTAQDAAGFFKHCGYRSPAQ